MGTAPVATLQHPPTNIYPRRCCMLRFGGSEQGELACMAHHMALAMTLRICLFFGGGQTKTSWLRPLTSQYSRQPLGIKVQSCPVL